MGSLARRTIVPATVALATALPACHTAPAALQPLTNTARARDTFCTADGVTLTGTYAPEADAAARAPLTQHTFATDGLDFDPDVASGAGLLAFASTRHSEHSAIFVQPLGSRDSVQLTPDTADHIQPRFSPDGEHIAFASNRGGDWDIWVMRRDGTGLIPLANDPAAEFSPCWSPDGTQIAFSVWSRRARTWEIWGCPVARPAARRLITTGMCPAWSPDGTCLAVQRAPQGGDRAFEIWTVDVASGNARRIAEKHGAACLAPRWSPDGKALLYCAVPTTVSAAGAGRDSPEIAELWTVDVRTGAEVRLPAAQGASFSPAWAADGRIFFVSGMSGTERIWSLAPETALLASGQSASGREHIITTRFTAID